jgi:hypothetical protein
MLFTREFILLLATASLGFTAPVAEAEANAEPAPVDYGDYGN